MKERNRFESETAILQYAENEFEIPTGFWIDQVNREAEVTPTVPSEITTFAARRALLFLKDSPAVF